MATEQGTNLNATLNAHVYVSLKDSSNNYATEIEVNGDPTTYATEANTYAIGCVARRSDLSSGAALYENKGNFTTPTWYLITTA